MADLKISQLSDGGNAQAADEFVVARSGANYRIDGASVAAAATSVGTLSSLTISGDLTVDTNTLKVDSAGNRVLMGLSAAIQGDPLEIQTLAGGGTVSLFGRVSDNGSTLAFRANGATTQKAAIIGSDTGLQLVTGTTVRATFDASGNLAVDTNTLYVDATNNRVGIGTASPGTTLHATAAGGTFSSPLGNVIARFNATTNTAGQGAGIALTALATKETAWVIAAEHTSGNNGDLTFYGYNGGATYEERMRLTASGNLGIGVTPSAWGSIFKAMQLGSGIGTAFIGGRTDASNSAFFGVNLFYNGTNWVRVGASYATRYYQADGTHVWDTSASSTAGSTISFTQAMTLDASGNLSAGTTGIASTGQSNGITSGSVVAVTDELFNHTTNRGILQYKSNITSLRSYGATSGTGIITFRTGGGGDATDTERARITSGGYFKASNDGTYRGATDAYHEMYQTSNDAGLVLQCSNASYSSDAFAVIVNRNTTNNSFYAINYYNQGAAAYKFRVADSGDVTNTNGTYGTISDAKLKHNIEDAPSQWNDLKAIRFRKYQMIDDPSQRTMLGVVAQELELVSPGLVEEHADTEQVEVPVLDEDGNETGEVTTEMRPTGTVTKSVKTSVLLMKAAVALQEAMARIEALEARLEALEA
jgi:hypothetical protein